MAVIHSIQMICAIYLLLLSNCAFSAQVKFACPLSWVKSSSSDPLPLFAVPTNTANPSHYIARVMTSKDYYVGGRYESKRAYIVENGVVAVHTNFEILTNPHKCQLSWENDQDSLSVPVDSNDGNFYTARGNYNSQYWSGVVRSGSGEIEIAGESGRVTLRSPIFLKSFSTGLRLQMTDFVITDDTVPARNDFMGVDEIYNDADVEVVQTVTYRKRIVESTTFTTEKNWGFAMSIGVKAGVSLSVGIGEGVGEVGIKVSIDTEMSIAVEGGSKETITKGEETEMIISRDVIVPPLMRVQLCAVLNIKENFVTNYQANGRYSAPGLNSDQVAAILAQDGLVGTPDGDTIVVSRSGTFGGTLVMNNKFIILPLGDGGLSGCTEIQRKIAEVAEMRRSTNNFTSSQILMEEMKINKFIDEITIIK